MDGDPAFSVFRRAAAHRWDARTTVEMPGGPASPVLGFLDTGFPEEVAIAAGYRPMLLTGDVDQAPDRVEPHLDASAPDRVRHLYEALATGRHDRCEVLCVTGGDRWLGETAGFFEVYGGVFGAPTFRHTLYLERARGNFAEHRTFNRDSIATLVDRLATIGPQAPTTERLRDAIALTNRTRHLLREVAALRAADVPQLSGIDAHAVTIAAMCMPKAAFNAALETALAERADSNRLADRPRIFVSGSAVDHDGVTRLIEELGGVVVGDDTEFGPRYGDDPVDEREDPIEAIADRYTYKFPESWAFGRERRIAQRVEMATAAHPDGVIALHLRGDNGYGWDHPDQAAALSAAGVPTLALSEVDYAMRDRSDLARAVASFLADLAGAADADRRNIEEYE